MPRANRSYGFSLTFRLGGDAHADRLVFLDLQALKQWWSVDRGLVEERPGGTWALAWERSDQRLEMTSLARVSGFTLPMNG